MPHFSIDFNWYYIFLTFFEEGGEKNTGHFLKEHHFKKCTRCGCGEDSWEKSTEVKSEASWTPFSLSCQHSGELLYRISSAVLYPFVNSFWTWSQALWERSFKTRTASFTSASLHLASLNSKSQIISCCYCWSISFNASANVSVDVFFLKARVTW